MDVKIIRGKHNRVEVQFHDWTYKDRNRMMRMEMDILKKVGYLGADAIESGKPRILYRDPPIQEFSEKNIQDIIKVLDGYMILPTVSTENALGCIYLVEET